MADRVRPKVVACRVVAARTRLPPKFPAAKNSPCAPRAPGELDHVAGGAEVEKIIERFWAVPKDKPFVSSMSHLGS